VISSRLLQLVRCPDCHGRLEGSPPRLRCRGCGREFENPSEDFLVLRPGEAYGETTKFLDESFHSDGRDETVSPPLLSAAVRNTMMRTFLDMKREDVVLDFGCGSGRFCVWSADSGAHVIGIDTGTFFASEARSRVDLVVGELRKLPFADESVTKAYTIDVLEHLSPEGLKVTLGEMARVLAPGGGLFVYTHVRQKSVLSPLLGLIGKTALAIERLGFADLTIEKLRKTDHLNPLMSRAHLDGVAAAAGLRVERFTYYTPLLSSVAENILVPVAAHAMARKAAKKKSRPERSRGAPPGVDREAMRTARMAAKARIGQRGFVYHALQAMTRVVMLDVTFFGRMKSGPFFALLVKTDGGSKRQDPPYVQRGT
jgi:ubiquinone/menaquinone biosynthesis C-methylase UbiE